MRYERHTKPKLLDRLREAIRVRHYSIRTEEVYVMWARRYILFHGKRHPKNLTAAHVNAFLSYLARERNVAASTQNQALCALVFLYRRVLNIEINDLGPVVRAKRPKRLPEVLTQAEVKLVLRQMDGIYRVMAELMYGAGLRLMEVLRLRVKDVDFGYNRVTIHDGKGGKDRVTMLPERVQKPLEAHFAEVKVLFTSDCDEGFDKVFLPHALARKYPNAERSWAWQFVFPSRKRSVDPRSGVVRRHHIHKSSVQRAVKQAARRATIPKA